VDLNSVLNFVLSILKWSASIFILMAIGFAVFVWSSAIDEKVTSGEAFGFKIGASKTEIFKTLPSSFYPASSKGDVVLFDVELYETNKIMPTIIKSKFINKEFELFEAKNKWTLFLDSVYFFDNVALVFCDEKLCEIKRKRFYLEFP
jgi:hypothetical protein